MPITAAAAVLLAALLHASWNAILRFNSDRLATLALLTGSAGVVGAIGIFFVPPPPAEAWPWLATSVLLHLGYNAFLATAYRYGELGKVYPLARGTAPLLTLGAGTFLVGEILSLHATLGIVLLGGGIIALTFDEGWRALLRNPKGPAFALGTSLFISAYSISDALGARASGNPHAYVMYLFALDGLPMALILLAARRRQTLSALRKNWLSGCIAGGLSMGAYWIVIWAMTIAPIALVAALRETSVLFAVLIGVAFLGEKLTRARLLSILVVLAGLAMIRL